MNSPILIANILALSALVIHIFLGDKEIRAIEPDTTNYEKIENWVMARGAFHIVSVDMFMITTGLTLINFTDALNENKILLLKIMSIYLLLYAVAFFVCVIISKPFPKNYLKLMQWGFFMLLSGLIYFGMA